MASKEAEQAVSEQPATPSLSSSAPAPGRGSSLAPKVAEPLEVTILLQCAEDDYDCQPEKCPPLSVTTETTVADLRVKCKEVFQWDDAVLSGVKFFRGSPSRGFTRLKHTEIVEQVLYVRGAPSLRPPESVE